MEVGAYLCIAGILWILGLALSARLRRRFYTYTAVAWAIPFLALALYLFVPGLIGMISTHVVENVPSPVTWHTYLDRGGAIGAILLLLYFLGLAWPLAAAWLVSHSGQRQSRFLARERTGQESRRRRRPR